MPLPFDVLERIDEVCTRFEQRWRSGPRPDLRDFLAGAGEERRALFRELLKLELEYRRKQGEQPSVADYRQRFADEDGATGFESIVCAEEPADGTLIKPRAAPSPDAPSPGTASHQALLQSSTLQRYRLGRILGQGAFGIVYLAEDQELNRFVALKVAHEARPVRGNHDAFLAEARVLASLDHPAIIPVYDVGRTEEGCRSYIVTKWIEGSNLSERLRQALPSRRQAAQWLVTIARGLQAAHEKGLVHRDVKPSNILIDKAEQAFIGDFGLALSEEHFGKGPRLLGTPAYMSPEQARGEGHRVDARSDIFSVGVVLYELLTGRPPFHAETVSKTLQHVVALEPVAPLRLNPTVGRDLDTICLRCLAKSPEKRYATAGALAEDLQRFLDNRSILARPAGPVEKLVRWSRRNPVVAAALTGVVVIFVTAFVLVSWSYFRAEQALVEEARQKQEAERREKAERWERYRSNLVAAASALQMNNVAAASDALQAAPLEHRNWEWQHFHHQLDTAEHTLRGPAGSNRIVFSADGGKAVLLYHTHAPVFLDLHARQARELLRFDGTEAADLSADGKVFAGACADHTVVLWDVLGHRQLTVLRGVPAKVHQLKFSPNRTLLAGSLTDQTVRIWDTASGHELHVLRGHRAIPSDLSFSADSHWLASADGADRTVRLWDLQNGQPPTVLSGHAGDTRFTLFSPQGDRVLVSEAYPSNVLRLWEVHTGKLLGSLRGHSNEVLALAFSPDGQRIATGSFDQTVRLWHGHTGELLATLQGHKGWVTSVAFSPDSKRLVSASQDRTLRLWDTAVGGAGEVGWPLAVLHGHTSPVNAVQYTADGATLVAGAYDGSVRLWNAQQSERGGILKGHTSFVYDVAFHPDGRRVASAAWDGTVRLWDATTGNQFAMLNYPDQGGGMGKPSVKTIVAGVAFHPGGQFLASVGRDDCVRLWNIDTGQEVERWSIPTNVNGDTRLAFSPRGDLLACGSKDGPIHLWRITLVPGGGNVQVKGSKVAELRGSQEIVQALVFSHDGTWLASGGGGKDVPVRIWDLSRKEQAHLLNGHTNNVVSLALTPDGQWLASGSADGTVRLWDATTFLSEKSGRPTAVLTQGSTVYGLAFTPDGTRLACACANNTIRLWDVATRQAVCDLHGHTAYVHQVAFSPDGARLVSGSGDFTVRIWDSLSQQQRRAKAKK